ncbi:MAG: hypothetical protein LBD18_00365 [Treponema sp.]|jgi:hypothetical protein|nr:hypothetical protein [Treponema sp.]
MKAVKWLGGLFAAIVCFVSCDIGVSYTAGTLGYRAGTGDGNGIQNGKSLVPVPERNQYRITQDIFVPESDVKVLLSYEDGTTDYIPLTDLEIRVYEGLNDLSEPVGDDGYSFPTLGPKKVGVWYEDLESYYWVTVYDPNAGGNNNGNNPGDGGGGGGTGGGLDWVWSHRP